MNRPIYGSWHHMMRRCTNPKEPYFQNYGGRGIKVCERWHSFDNFVADMGPRPAGMSLDRVNNDGDYTPENCRWADQIQQHNNKSSNVLITHDGRTQTMASWARELGVRRGLLHSRLKRMPFSEAIARPLAKKAPPTTVECAACSKPMTIHQYRANEAQKRSQRICCSPECAGSLSGTKIHSSHHHFVKAKP